jgi:arylsulfatase A-like enzyme
MLSRIAVFKEVHTVGSLTPAPATKRLGLTRLLLLSAWCGVVAGLLEVGTIVLRKQLIDPNQLYGMCRHFPWLIPVTNLYVFLALGIVTYFASLAWPRRDHGLVTRLLCALTVLPVLLVAVPRVYTLAWFIAALGVAAHLVPLCERNAGRFRRFVLLSFPVVLGIVVILWAAPSIRDRLKQARAAARPLPAPGSPNVLLVVLDTVAAGHLSLHGYDRMTSTSLAELAERGIRFDSAQAASSWTLPSHATMFTGREMHELSVGWLTPLDETRPTLAEFLTSRGYATAGFVANTKYCASDSGLGRGFASYQDYVFPRLTALKTAILVDRALTGIESVVESLGDRSGFALLRRAVPHLWRLLINNRKEAATVNREFLDWLSRRQQPQRPFFAFLNFCDAHYPYRLPSGRIHRFGIAPVESHDRILIQHWFELDKTRLPPQDVAFSAAAYDDCIADLDEQLGKLVDMLARRGVLERTWLVVTSDHGESFGEHAGVFCHGSSLYQTELHVPLVIIPPGGCAAKQVVTETVSLRDLAATIVDVLGMASGSPFPGVSLARFWNGTEPATPQRRASADPALAEVVPNDSSNFDPSGLPRKTWPLGALVEDEWSYIRREGDLREELFNLRTDAKEQRNLAGDMAAQPTLRRMRAALGRRTAGPLAPQRFSR